MKGYIYPMFRGADPGKGWVLTDPLFTRKPTLGACMPNIRRAVTKGDYIFAISGRFPGVRQYVVGGFRVDEKIDALSAFHRFPKNRLRSEDGALLGNIIVDANGERNPLDYHNSFQRRIENYVVGSDPVYMETANEIERSRTETLDALKKVFKSDENSISSIIARWRRMNEDQVEELLAFLRKLKN